MDDQTESGGQTLVRSVWSSGLREITADSVEILLDSVLDEGLLREIPVASWIARTYGIARTVREQTSSGAAGSPVLIFFQ